MSQPKPVKTTTPKGDEIVLYTSPKGTTGIVINPKPINTNNGANNG